MKKAPKELPMTPPQRLVETMTFAEFEALPSHEAVRLALESLDMIAVAFAGIIGVAPQTVWRWMRDPHYYKDSARSIDPVALRVLFWMLKKGRPACWPAPRLDMDE